MIRIPSVNPAFTARSDWAGEARMVSFLEDLAAKAGLESRRQRVSEGRDNLIVRLRSMGQKRCCVLLAPHLDTIAATQTQFSGQLSQNRIWGRGACDTKGSVAAMFYSLLDLAADANRPAGLELCFVGLVDEENAQLGSRAFAQHWDQHCGKTDLAIIGEPTNLQIVTAHKGDFWLALETKGKAAHGARPDFGENAIIKMSEILLALETKYASALKRKSHKLLGNATINVGVIRGGNQPNVVPDHCVIHVDRRTLPGESFSAVKREIQSIANSIGVDLKITNLRDHLAPALETNPDLPAVKQFLKATGQSQTYGVDYFCDAAIIAEAGVPCIVFGPGDIAQAHTAKEWISVSSLRRATALLSRYLRSFS